VLYQRNPQDVAANPEAGQAVFEAACAEFGAENLRHDKPSQKGTSLEFPVLLKDGRTASSVQHSETLGHLPVVAGDYVFIVPELWQQADAWLQENRSKVIAPITRRRRKNR
jgi:hypothetical protein